MNLGETEQIKGFINNQAMSNTVRAVLEDAITKPCKDRDVHILAARFLALELFREAWKDMQSFVYTEGTLEKPVVKQVGL